MQPGYEVDRSKPSHISHWRGLLEDTSTTGTRTTEHKTVTLWFLDA